MSTTQLFAAMLEDFPTVSRELAIWLGTRPGPFPKWAGLSDLFAKLVDVRPGQVVKVGG